jgi:hypothetical protein
VGHVSGWAWSQAVADAKESFNMLIQQDVQSADPTGNVSAHGRHPVK